jgi:HEAT repeat protein
VTRLLAAILLLAGPGVSQHKDLFERLISSCDDEVRNQAVREARQLGPDAQRQLISRLIEAFSSEGSYDASLDLAEFGEAAVAPLIQALHSPDQTVRYRASEALGRISPPAVQPLVEVLHDPSPQVRSAASHALELVGQSAAPAVPALIPLLQSDSADQTRSVINALGSIGSSDALSALRSELRATKFQPEALNALARMGHRAVEAVGDVLPLLKSPKSLTRMIAARTLGEIALPSRSVVGALMNALSDPDWDPRQSAAAALGKLGPAASPAAPKIRDLLHDNDASVRHAAVEALGKIGPAATDAVPDIIALWLDEDLYTRQAAVAAVSGIGPTAVPALTTALRDANSQIRVGAAWQLGEFQATNAVPALATALGDKEAIVQAEARQAMEKIASPEAKEALAKVPMQPPSALRLLSLAQVESPIPPAQGQRSAFVRAAKVDIAGPNGISLIATIHRSDDGGDVLRIWKQAGERYRLLYKKDEATEPGMSGYEEPEGFRLGSEYFVHLMLLFSGTGYMHEDTVLWIAPDATLHPVEFVPPATKYKRRLGPREDIRKGENNDFEDDKATFEFGIWEPRDPNCCPSGGTVTGHYRLTGQKHYNPATKRWSAQFRIGAADFDREPIAALPAAQ